MMAKAKKAAAKKAAAKKAAAKKAAAKKAPYRVPVVMLVSGWVNGTFLPEGGGTMVKPEQAEAMAKAGQAAVRR